MKNSITIREAMSDPDKMLSLDKATYDSVVNESDRTVAGSKFVHAIGEAYLQPQRQQGAVSRSQRRATERNRKRIDAEIASAMGQYTKAVDFMTTEEYRNSNVRFFIGYTQMTVGLDQIEEGLRICRKAGLKSSISNAYERMRAAFDHFIEVIERGMGKDSIKNFTGNWEFLSGSIEGLNDLYIRSVLQIEAEKQAARERQQRIARNQQDQKEAADE